MLSSENNAGYGLFSIYYIISKIIFDNQVLLTPDIPLCDLPDLNFQISGKPIYSELEPSLKYILERQEKYFYRHEDELQWGFVIFMKEITYWQRMTLGGSMSRFLTVMFAMHLCCCHRKLIYAAVMALMKFRMSTKLMLPIFALHQSNTS